MQNLELRLPVLEEPGAAGGTVAEPAPKVVPAGYELAPGFAQGEESEPPAPPKLCRGREATILGSTGGDDIIRGPDFVKGGKGRDELWGGKGRDRLRGGPGRDLIDGRRERRR